MRTMGGMESFSAPLAGKGPSMGGYKWDMRTSHITLTSSVVDRTTETSCEEILKYSFGWAKEDHVGEGWGRHTPLYQLLSLTERLKQRARKFSNTVLGPRRETKCHGEQLASSKRSALRS